MSSFTQFESFDRVPNTHKKYVLTEDLKWEISKKGSTWVLVVEKGTVFDISVPRRLEWMQSPHDRSVLPAAAIHDQLLVDGHDFVFASSEFRRACVARGNRPSWAWMLFFSTFYWTFRWS